MAFLAPLVWLGLATLAVPVIIHMIQRERSEVIEFPSLMFLRRIPYHSFRRQRIRHWLLLLLRCAAIALLLAAFARPFLRDRAMASAAVGPREVVVLVDRSYSMGYGDRWSRAQDAAASVIAGLGPEDRISVILFDSGAEAGPQSTTDQASAAARLASAAPGSGTTRFGPALTLAEGILADSDLPRREAVFISDFQRAGVDSIDGVRFGAGTTLTPLAVGDARIENVSVAGVAFEREAFSGRERLRVVAHMTNHGSAPVTGLDVALELGGRTVETLPVDLPANGSAAARFASVTLGTERAAGAVRVAGDGLTADDTFHFVAAPRAIVSVLIVGNARTARDDALYLRHALGIGTSPDFAVETLGVNVFDAGDLDDRQVVILNDTPPPSGAHVAALEQFAAGGGGVLIAVGERSVWPQDAAALLPGTLGPPRDRTAGGRLSQVDYSHPVFELFSGPRSGDVTSARFLRYRPLTVDETATVLARFDDGAPALVERRVGDGRVAVWTSTLDSFWNDLALKPVYLPFVHRLVEHLAAYRPPTPWFATGQVVNLAEHAGWSAAAGIPADDPVAVSPSGARIPVRQDGQAGFLALAEPGFYEIRDAALPGDEPLTLAVNVDRAESDLTAIDPEELASQVTSRATGGPDGPAAAPVHAVTSEELERRQGVWWYLLIAAFALFAAETVVSNRLSRAAGAVT